MKKLLFALLITAGILNAGLVNAIAFIVNEEPITLYDIDKKMSEGKLNKNQAVGILIDELLYEQELKNNNITVDMFDVNNYLERLAASNKMDLYQFKSIIKQKYKDFSVYENEIKKQILRQKLVTKAIRGNLKLPEQDDLNIYYENHLKEFSTASKFHVVQYVTKNKRSLLAIRQNPMAVMEDVKRDTLVFEQEKLNSQFKYLLNDTQEKNFTPIFTSDKNFVMLFVTKKEGTVTQEFKEVKDKIFEIIVSEKEKKFLQEYFEKIKLTADIKVIR